MCQQSGDVVCDEVSIEQGSADLVEELIVS